MAKPKALGPIMTKALPRICPACAHRDVARVDLFGIWRLTCQRCHWSERYQVQR